MTGVGGDFEPLVSEQLFGRVRRVLAGPGPTAHDLNNPEFPLRRFVTCERLSLWNWRTHGPMLATSRASWPILPGGPRSAAPGELGDLGDGQEAHRTGVPPLRARGGAAGSWHDARTRSRPGENPMMLDRLLRLALLLVLMFGAGAVTPPALEAGQKTTHVKGYATAQPPRILDCESTFPPQLTAAMLENTFGTEQMGTGEIQTGDEGLVFPVTVLFPRSAEDRVEIVWKDDERKRDPAQVWIRGEKSRWRTPAGLTVGLALRFVERLNRRPFMLAGFGRDHEGTETSWRNGRLAAEKGSACGVRVVFAGPPEQPPYSRQVRGGHVFSSGHPAMQALNPKIERLWLEYR
jgi:hypothetical protein